MEIKKYATKLLPTWTKEVPFQIKGIAIKTACTAFWAAKGRPKFKSRKNPLQTCFIPKSAIKETGIYPRVSGKGLYVAEDLPENLCDSRLIWRNGIGYLGACYKETILREAKTKPDEIVALDPGIRTFISSYSPSSSGKIGESVSDRLYNYFIALDNLYSRISKSKNTKQKRSYRKAAFRLREKVTNLITELHYETANFLCDNFKAIILPKFETQQMSNKAKRKIKTKTVRSMMTLSFYKFRKRLEWVALKKSVAVTYCSEEYTSKTHPQTGVVNHKLGSTKEVKLVDGSRADRDIVGAFNLFMKALVVDKPAFIGATYNYL